MNNESLLTQFSIVEQSLNRAKLPFEVGMGNKEAIEVTLYELIKSWYQIENMIREIDPKRFGVKTVQSIDIPKLEVEKLYLCPHCGSQDCQSDHK